MRLRGVGARRPRAREPFSRLRNGCTPETCGIETWPRRGSITTRPSIRSRACAAIRTSSTGTSCRARSRSTRELEPIPLARDLVGSQRAALDAIADDGVRDDAGVSRGRARPAHPPALLHRGNSQAAHLGDGRVVLSCRGVHRQPASRRRVRRLRRRSTGLDAGLYHFAPHDFALRRLRAGDQRAALIEATAAEPHVVTAPVVLISTSTYWRNAWKYRSRTYRHCFWDSGTSSPICSRWRRRDACPRTWCWDSSTTR